MSSKQKLQKKRDNFLPYILLVIVLGYAVFLLVSSQNEIAQKRAEYEMVHAKLTHILSENEQLEWYAEDENRYEYMEDIARDKLGFADPSERIYYIIPK